jgi:hypothetical protein
MRFVSKARLSAAPVPLGCGPDPTAMMQHSELLSRIEAFSLDEPGIEFTFTQRLAREHGWTVNYAQRVVREYKRFTFLAVAAGHPVTPSEDVDEAWHLHLLYTQSYWKKFCGEVLQRALHHQPTRVGGREGVKFREWYLQTLASYKEHFLEEPPPDIWPGVEQRFAGVENRRVKLREHWMVPKPRSTAFSRGLGS